MDNEINIVIGTKNDLSMTVTEEKTAKAIGSGDLEVLATPVMIALMEKTANESIKAFLPEGMGSVGTAINVSHVSATPKGMTIRAVSEVTAFDGRRVCFSLKAYDECGLIGEGSHERFIIKNEKFLNKANGKIAK